jgi:hypothetical protein
VSGDPLALLWNTLEAGGYRPRGKPHAFRARCPVHDGDNPASLSVGIGADGRALLWCHARACEPAAIVAALGLTVADLFPDGHLRGRRYPLRPVRRADFTGAALTAANVLFALERIEEPWTLMIGCRCPYCGSEGGWLRGSRAGLEVDCAGGCDTRTFTTALLARLEEKGKAA